MRREHWLDALDRSGPPAGNPATGITRIAARAASSADTDVGPTAASLADTGVGSLAASLADADVESAAAAVEAAAAALEHAVTARDFTRIGTANATLHGALRALERALAAKPPETASSSALLARLSPLLERHERLTGTVIELRDAVRDELVKTRKARGAAARYLENSE